MVRAWLNAFGADVTEISSAPGNRAELALCFHHSADADPHHSLGGTGRGRKDCAVAALGDAGSIALHGVALRPGAGMAFGQVGTTPVMLFPDRIDGLFANFLVLAVEASAYWQESDRALVPLQFGLPRRRAPLSDSMRSSSESPTAMRFGRRRLRRQVSKRWRVRPDGFSFRPHPRELLQARSYICGHLGLDRIS